jgi:hypothetical protein
MCSEKPAMLLIVRLYDADPRSNSDTPAVFTHKLSSCLEVEPAEMRAPEEATTIA